MDRLDGSHKNIDFQPMESKVSHNYSQSATVLI